MYPLSANESHILLIFARRDSSHWPIRATLRDSLIVAMTLSNVCKSTPYQDADIDAYRAIDVSEVGIMTSRKGRLCAVFTGDVVRKNLVVSYYFPNFADLKNWRLILLFSSQMRWFHLALATRSLQV
jgi:hypothetical protein